MAVRFPGPRALALAACILLTACAAPAGAIDRPFTGVVANVGGVDGLIDDAAPPGTTIDSVAVTASGFITSWKFAAGEMLAGETGTVQLRIYHSNTPGQQNLQRSSTPMTLTGPIADGAIQEETGLTLKVDAGDHIAVRTTGDASVRLRQGPGKIAWAAEDDATTFLTNSHWTDVDLAVAARVEGDADGDGYADGSADGCPLVASEHVKPCHPATITQSFAPDTVQLGEPSTLTITMTNQSILPLYVGTLEVHFDQTIYTPSPIGGATAGCGASAWQASCTLDPIPVGATVTVAFRVEADRTFSATTTMKSADPVTTTLTVLPHPGTTPAPPKPCTVPALVRVRLDKARRLLRAAHCRLGKVLNARAVPRARRERLRVRRQSLRAGTTTRAGAPVDVVLRVV